MKALKPLEHQFGDDGVFIMEYEDFLTHWEVIERTQVFDPTWIQSSHWLEVSGRPSLTAVQYGDVSCKDLILLSVYMLKPDHIFLSAVHS